MITREHLQKHLPTYFLPSLNILQKLQVYPNFFCLQCGNHYDFTCKFLFMRKMDQQRKKSLSSRLQVCCFYQNRQGLQLDVKQLDVMQLDIITAGPSLCTRPCLDSMCAILVKYQQRFSSLIMIFYV